jgi:uroporphyrinogen III methyltransferase/synthase
MKQGKVWLVGAGPSDAGLFTLKGKSLLEQADVVMYDSLVGDGILGMIPAGVKLINVGKRAGQVHMSQEQINKVLLDEALSGSRVVRLKGGDPFLFGRGGEELELLKENGIPYEIVPGITSAIAVPAYAGIPVTHRDYCSSVHIITGHKKDTDKPEIDFEALVRLKGTLVFLMGVGSLEYICKSLIQAGLSPNTPAAVLEKGTSADQRRVVADLIALPEEAFRQAIKTPAIIVVGEVCGLADEFHWAEDRELGGASVIVTRPQQHSSKIAERLRGLGAEVLEIPAIKTIEIEDNSRLDTALKNIGNYGWVVFTSQAGVEIFFKRLISNSIDIRKLAGIKLAAIGSATKKAVEEHGVIIDCVPETYDTLSLGKSLAAIVKPDERLLIPRAKIGSADLTDELKKAGIVFDDIPVYDTVSSVCEALNIKTIITNKKNLYVAFTSASTVKGFVEAAGDCDYSSIKAVCIGKQTAGVASKYGMKTYISDEITVDSLADKISQLHRAEKES